MRECTGDKVDLVYVSTPKVVGFRQIPSSVSVIKQLTFSSLISLQKLSAL